MATRSLLKYHSNLTSHLLRKSFHLTTPIAQSTIIDEAFLLPLAQKSQHPRPSPSFFLGANQKLLVGEEGFLSARQCLRPEVSAVSGSSLWAKGRGGSSSYRKKIDSDEEFDNDDVDSFHDDDDYNDGSDDPGWDEKLSDLDNDDAGWEGCDIYGNKKKK